MNRKLLVVVGTVAAVFVVAVVAASTLNLSGSDSAPGEGTTEATCTTNLVVKTPITTSSDTIAELDLTGDLSNCVGQTVRADVSLIGGSHFWAVHKITSSDLTAITLHFNATTGDFTDTKPTASSGELVVAGQKVGPVAVKDFGTSTIMIAKTWK